jgi:hypothetical protein
MTFADRLILPALKKQGPMPLAAIYDGVKSVAKRRRIRLTPHWQATVRNTLQRHCKGHPKQRGKVRFIHYCHGTWGAK